MLHGLKFGTLVAVLVLCSAALCEEPELVSGESGGILTVDRASRLVVQDIHGTFSLRVGKDGELRYETRVLADRKQEQPVAVWLDGGAYVVTPYDAEDNQPLLMELVVPTGMAIELNLADSRVKINDLRSDLTLEGRGVDLQAVRLTGALELNLDGGTVLITGATDDVKMRLVGVKAEVSQVVGTFRLEAEDSAVLVADLQEGLDAEIERTGLTVNGANGAVSVEAEGGSVSLAGLREGGKLRLTEASLTAMNSRGALEVETDGPVEFQGLAGSLKIRNFGYGGSVVGKGSTATVEIRTNGAAVQLSEMGGKIDIEGDDLEVKVSGTAEEVSIKATTSRIHVETARGPLIIENEFGDIVIDGAEKEVQVSSRDGDVTVSALKAPLELHADGNSVEVRWAEVQPGHKDSLVENQRGDVNLSLPATARCRVDVKASGRVDSSLSDVEVADDGTSAAGMIGRGSNPIIRAMAGGDLYLRQN